MNGTPKSLPTNHVEWDNGFKSNMPDWQTARRCAHSHRLLSALKSARTALLAMDKRAGNEWNPALEYSVYDSVVNSVQETIDLADGLDVVKQALSGFPKPPGFK